MLEGDETSSFEIRKKIILDWKIMNLSVTISGGANGPAVPLFKGPLRSTKTLIKKIKSKKGAK